MEEKKNVLEPIIVNDTLAKVILHECEYWILNLEHLSHIVDDDDYNNDYLCEAAMRCTLAVFSIPNCVTSEADQEIFQDIQMSIDEKIIDLCGFTTVFGTEEAAVELVLSGGTQDLISYIKLIEQKVQTAGSEGKNLGTKRRENT